MCDSTVETLKGKLEHRKNVINDPNRSGHGPKSQRRGIKPCTMMKQLGQQIKSVNARQSTAFLDVNGPIGCHKFIRSHAGIAHNDEPRFRVPGGEVLDALRLVSSRRVFPDKVINSIVKEKGFQVLEL